MDTSTGGVAMTRRNGAALRDKREGNGWNVENLAVKVDRHVNAFMNKDRKRIRERIGQIEDWEASDANPTGTHAERSRRCSA
jgi:hypothetical protein